MKLEEYMERLKPAIQEGYMAPFASTPYYAYKNQRIPAYNASEEAIYTYAVMSSIAFQGYRKMKGDLRKFPFPSNAPKDFLDSAVRAMRCSLALNKHSEILDEQLAYYYFGSISAMYILWLYEPKNQGELSYMRSIGFEKIPPISKWLPDITRSKNPQEDSMKAFNILNDLSHPIRNMQFFLFGHHTFMHDLQKFVRGY